MVKMLLLEELHRTSFSTLAAAPVQERKTIVARWEAWANPSGKEGEEGEEGEDATLPDGIDKATKEWASAQPSP